MEKNQSSIYYLEDIDYKVASEDPDVRGWDFLDCSKRIIGRIKSLLVDIVKKKVLYLDVKVKNEILREDHQTFKSSGNGVYKIVDQEGEIHMVIPVGMVRIDRANKTVISDKIDEDYICHKTTYRRSEGFNSDYEDHVLNKLEFPPSPNDKDRYEGELFPEIRLFDSKDKK